MPKHKDPLVEELEEGFSFTYTIPDGGDLASMLAALKYRLCWTGWGPPTTSWLPTPWQVKMQRPTSSRSLQLCAGMPTGLARNAGASNPGKTAGATSSACGTCSTR